MKYSIEVTNAFKKDYKKIVKRGYKTIKLEAVVDMLAKDIELPEKYRDHQLKGELSEYRECHIEPDWLLIYKKVENVLILYLIATGTHSDLFDL